MNKLVSFLIIIIIIYISYEYCSITSTVIEGANNKRTGDYDESKDRPVVDECANVAQVDEISTNKLHDNKCAYKNKSCTVLMDNQTVRDNWTYGAAGESKTIKKNCMRCIQGSMKDSTTRRYLSLIAADPANGKRDSKFAYNLCDGLAAECEDALFYSNNSTDWAHSDCVGVSLASNHSKLNKFMCQILTNSFLQFFLSFMGGVTCTLKIKTYELEQKVVQMAKDAKQYIKDIPSKITKAVKDAF